MGLTGAVIGVLADDDDPSCPWRGESQGREDVIGFGVDDVMRAFALDEALQFAKVGLHHFWSQQFEPFVVHRQPPKDRYNDSIGPVDHRRRTRCAATALTAAKTPERLSAVSSPVGLTQPRTSTTRLNTRMCAT